MPQHEEGTDHYTTLEADEGASREEIERHYKRLARRHHPDRGGDEERMKSINEAYRVLGNASERAAYDAARRGDLPAAAREYEFTPRRSPSAQADVLGGRLLGAWLCVLCGLVLLFLVRAHYVRFLWPLALLAGAVVLGGVLMAYGTMRFARATARPRWLFGRAAWAQELAFWSCVVAGVYGVYRLLTAI